MAWQMHYTSARNGPTGRSGFQFTAETPGLPDRVRAAVAPFLAYRPPPTAPLSPGPGELAAFPVALLYDRVDGRPLLARSRYLGQDYSGRYGNFFAHAVVAEPDELEGLRPAELWDAPLWRAGPTALGALPEVPDLAPDAAFAPDALAEWLRGQPDLLAPLVDAVVAVLGRGHGRVVLVAADVELIARWIAVVSYSLPVSAAERLTFVTYSADPDGAGQRVVGTTPDAWAAAQYQGGPAFALGDAPPPRRPVSRFARTVAACWRAGDFAALDALGELALLDGAGPPGPRALERAAALLALCRGEARVTPDEEAGAAALLARSGRDLPEWVWRDLVPGVPSMGVDLAVAVEDRARAAGAVEAARRAALRAVTAALDDPSARDRLPRRALPAELRPALEPAVTDALAAAEELTDVARIAGIAAAAGAPARPGEIRAAAQGRARVGAADVPAALAACPDDARGALLAGVVTGLAAADAPTRDAVLGDRTCDLLHDAARDDPDLWPSAPAVALAVLDSVGRSRPLHRVAVTADLLSLADVEIDAVLERLWAAAPQPGECLELLEAHAAAFAERPVLAELPSRTFARALGDADIGVEVLRLAARIRSAPPAPDAGRDAAAVQACATAIGADRPDAAAEALAALADRAAGPLAEPAFGVAAGRLARRDPVARAALLAAAPARLRARLGARWTGALPGRGGDPAARHELIETVLRMRVLGAADPALETWARTAVTRWFAGRRLEAHFGGDPALRSALRDLAAEARTGNRGRQGA
ncbi:hypothetical protein BTM25_44990 [Actinomadura rubteroloni]|uniref:Uncharacterized protein n=1 Tax=Actinomadura rubteroloni TaxID=1926885 RepID=A0A2P4UE88_9ACTN|nr:hypothetical protein [Actinomadura rubteroloni]POM23346.1 hypothetical protein BTM25_44990 [Actinomadura rubteroloni]